MSLTVALEDPILELLATVGAHKTLRVKLLRHGRDNAAGDQFSAHDALVLAPICLVEAGHLLEESPSEHLGHVLLRTSVV